MKKVFSILISLSVFISVLAQTATKYQVDKLWKTDTVLTTVESLKYDADNNCIYAACIDGKPSAKDGNGYIAKLSIDGKIIDKKWIDNLDAPKGMGIYKDTLYVTNIDELVEIDMQTPQISKRIKIKGAEFLNDIDVDVNTGRVFISDMATSKIHVYQNNEVTLYSNNVLLKGCNRLYFKDHTLYAGTKNGVVSFNETNKKAFLFIEHNGGIDGLEAFEGNAFLVSNWAGEVAIISPGNAKIILFDTSKKGVNAADIDYIPEKNIILVPTFFANKAVAYKISKQY